MEFGISEEGEVIYDQATRLPAVGMDSMGLHLRFFPINNAIHS